MPAAVLEHLKTMSEERFLAIYEALGNQGYGPLDKQVAELLRFRPVAIKKLPMKKRAHHGRNILLRNGGDEELCYEFFGTHLMTHHKELITSFLDKTGVAHQEGMIEDVGQGAPQKDKIEATVKELDEAHDPDDVTLYLALAAQMWPQEELLTKLWQQRTGASDKA